MDSVKSSSVIPKKSKFARTVAKVLHLRALGGVAPVDGAQIVKSQEKARDDKNGSRDDKNGSKNITAWLQSLDVGDEFHKSVALEALLAKLFASVSSIKAAYIQLQYAQTPYDADGVQAADILVVSELKALSELKQCYIKKQFDPSPETTMLLAEVQEQKSICKTYEITGKQLESQLKLRDSELMYLRERLEESNRQNRVLEKGLNDCGHLSVFENVHHSDLSPTHFIAVLRFTVKSIRSFVRLMIEEMKLVDWDLDAAAISIVQDVVYWRADDKCFAFECFVWREMFDGFHLPTFGITTDSPPGKMNQAELFFKRFGELKSAKARDYLAKKSKSTFVKFCHSKYLQLVHPKMETSFFGNSTQRDMINSGAAFPDTSFFASFAEMAKWVWLLHCLAFSFEPEASIFQVPSGCRFSEVYMECVAEDALLSSENAPEADPPVAFTVVPGFRIGKTVIQCQVYLSQVKSPQTKGEQPLMICRP